mgnify:CR=1 FL=1
MLVGETPTDDDERWSRLPPGRAPTPDDSGDDAPLPLDGDVLLYAGATASVGPERIEPLLRTVQAHLRERRGAYRRRYESAFEDDERRVLLVPTDHWASLGDELGLPDREVDAARRAHAQQLKRIGSKTDRREEFETALEIRGAVVIGK